MANKNRYHKYYIALKISLFYLVVSSFYIVFSDHIITSIFGNNLSIEFITRVQTYKGLGFVLITSFLLFVLIQREIMAKRESIRELKLQREGLIKLRDENEIVKRRLQDRNSYIETILKNLPIGLAVNKIDEGNTIFINKQFTKIYGWDEKYLSTQARFFEHVYPDEHYRNSIRKQVLEDIESGNPQKMQWEGIEVVTKSGEKRFVNAQNIPLYEQNLMISTVQDVTTQKRNERLITTEITLSEEKQRKEIAANIHDHLSQLLVVSKMKLTDIQNADSLSVIQNDLKAVVNFISEALENTRKITYDLSPPILYELGLIETMYWLAEKTQNDHLLKTEFTTDVKQLELSESSLILIFRTIQELVNNAVRHAQANNLFIDIKLTDDSVLKVTVCDNGKGFNSDIFSQSKIAEGGFGLFTIRERVQNLGGSISIDSEKGKGAKVRICVPLK